MKFFLLRFLSRIGQEPAARSGLELFNKGHKNSANRVLHFVAIHFSSMFLAGLLYSLPFSIFEFKLNMFIVVFPLTCWRIWRVDRYFTFLFFAYALLVVFVAHFAVDFVLVGFALVSVLLFTIGHFKYEGNFFHPKDTLKEWWDGLIWMFASLGEWARSRLETKT